MTSVLIIIVVVIIVIIFATANSKKNSDQKSETPSKTDGKIKVDVIGPDPERGNDYRCYKFVQQTIPILLDGWYKVMKEQGRNFKPNFEEAIKQKLETGNFKNPLNFKEFFGNKFDFIAIDFETASNERISACAIGLAFMKDKRIVDEDYYYIKPPPHIAFQTRNIALHGITAETVEYQWNFLDLWNDTLKELLCDNLVLLHNSSMDASVLRQLFLFYNITDYKIEYVDTMQIAKKLGYPGKLKELCSMFSIDFTNEHDPTADAVACAEVAGEFEDKGILLRDYIKKL